MPQINHKELRKLASLVRAMQGLVDRIEKRVPTLTAEQKARIDTFKAENRCLVCEKDFVEGEEIRRGAHQACFNRVAMQIAKGTRSEQAAVDAGEWNPIPEPPGRKPKHSRAVKRAVAGMVEAVKRDSDRDKKPAKRDKSRR